MENSRRVTTTGPEIIENYKDYEPPARLKGIVEDLVEAVPSKYLVGLKAIILTNQAALSRDQRRQKVWSRNRKYSFAQSRGAYYRATKSRPATVWLFVDNILRAWPAGFLRIPFLRYAELSDVLFHEIGHHIHAVHKRVYEGKENVAEDWSSKLSGRFYRRRYWYLMPILYPLARLIILSKRIKRKTNQ